MLLDESDTVYMRKRVHTNQLKLGVNIDIDAVRM